jgi:hypothetical protein
VNKAIQLGHTERKKFCMQILFDCLTHAKKIIIKGDKGFRVQHDSATRKIVVHTSGGARLRTQEGSINNSTKC